MVKSGLSIAMEYAASSSRQKTKRMESRPSRRPSSRPSSRPSARPKPRVHSKPKSILKQDESDPTDSKKDDDDVLIMSGIYCICIIYPIHLQFLKNLLHLHKILRNKSME